MKAIRTRYIGPTDYRGARIKATAEGVPSLTVPYDDAAHSGEGVHRIAAEALATRQGWTFAALIGGQLPDGDYAFVFAPGDR